MIRRSLVPVLRRMYLLLALLAVLQPAVHARVLPPRVAAWWGLDGLPLAFASRALLLGAMAATMLAIAALTLFGLPALCARRGREERQERCARLGLWLAIVTTGFGMCLFQLVLEANARPIPALDPGPVAWLAGSYALFLAAWAWAARRG